MATFVPPKKNTSYTFYWALVSQADTKIFQANPTLAAGDVKVAIDDGAPANMTTLPVVDADFTKRIKVALSAAEMNGDNISIIFADAAGAEWCDTSIDIQTTAQTFDEIAISGEAMTVTRSTGAFVGTDESTGTVVSAGSTVTGSEVDVLADNTSQGMINLYGVFLTPTAGMGPFEVFLNSRRVTGEAYQKLVSTTRVTPPAGSTIKYFLGRFEATRFMNVTVKNNGSVGGSVSILYELEKVG